MRVAPAPPLLQGLSADAADAVLAAQTAHLAEQSRALLDGDHTLALVVNQVPALQRKKKKSGSAPQTDKQVVEGPRVVRLTMHSSRAPPNQGGDMRIIV